MANSRGKSLARDDEHLWVDSPNRGAAMPIRTPTPTFSGDAFPGCFGLTDGGSPSRCRAYFVAAFLTTAFFATTERTFAASALFAAHIQGANRKQEAGKVGGIHRECLYQHSITDVQNTAQASTLLPYAGVQSIGPRPA